MINRAAWAIILTALLVVGLLAGCAAKPTSIIEGNFAANKTVGSSANTTTNGVANDAANGFEGKIKAETDTGTDTSTKSSENSELPDAGELIDRIIVAGKQLKSFSVEEDSYQRIISNISNTPTEQIIDTVASSEVIKEPFQMYAKSKAKMGTGDKDTEMDMDLEQYVTEDAIYMNFGNWMKMNEELSGKAMPAMREGGNPERQLKPYQSVLEALEVHEEGEHYVIRAKLDNNQLLKFADSYRNQTNDRGELLMENNSEVSFRKANIVFTVHKDTYYPVEISLSLDMDRNVSGSKVSIESEARSKFSNYNKIKQIKVPQEVLELE
ncbi:DUF6612 family protein [Paenibacillus lentus]|uniref:Lipoprotein n=1 Tax=Paenibacillus lentus TaxID=1338368 RepID=A0A3S8RZS9_9BACL|nr:DUF6612 family protein [Paenibacillus lentus]AZK48425.1 hypothetical protein EIM92_21465 [Paenibacillus lentus]